VPARKLQLNSSPRLPTAPWRCSFERRSAFMEPKTKYARSGDIYIAYRVFGDGPRDILLVPGTISHVELFWELPANAYLLKRLSSFARVIVFDKRGQGLSDRVAEQSIEERIDDVRAVMDAVKSKRATIYGWSEGGPMSLTFAAKHPDRTPGPATSNGPGATNRKHREAQRGLRADPALTSRSQARAPPPSGSLGRRKTAAASRREIQSRASGRTRHESRAQTARR
jgi:pimeloyl-ACP methyl ester carboxylesterase